ncbi:MAG TPA: DUF5703 family protein [Jiangellaceae bacterium]
MGSRAPSERRAHEYEFQHVLLPRGTSRSAARQVLTDHAEYGHWEIARLRLFPDGTRKVTLRRRIMRIARPQALSLR